MAAGATAIAPGRVVSGAETLCARGVGCSSRVGGAACEHGFAAAATTRSAPEAPRSSHMRTLFRIVLTLLMALPILLVLIVFWGLQGRRGQTPELERRAP